MTAAPRPDRAERRSLLTETWLVLGVSLGASAIWSILRIIERLTRQVALSQQTAAMNSSVTPDRPLLDLTYQIVGIGLGVLPAVLALHLLMTRPGPSLAHPIAAHPSATHPSLTHPAHADPEPGPGSDLGTSHTRRGRLGMGLDFGAPLRDLGQGVVLAAVIGLPGLGLYLAAKSIGLNTTVAAANLASAWWTIPILILAAAQNAILEEVVMVGYLFRRWSQAGWTTWRVILTSAAIRGSYHLYQGFGGFVGNLIMGVIFGWIYTRTKRVLPLIVAHTLLDVVAFVGYSLLKGHVGWL